MDWSRAGVLKPDGTLGIPDASSGTRCATLSPANTLKEINDAIIRCSNQGQLQSRNQEVFLQAGTYQLSDSIQFGEIKNVTLRGAGRGSGAGATILNFNGDWSHGGIHFIGSRGLSLIYNTVDTTKVRDWTAGYAPGTTTITLSSVAGIAPGNIIQLDQLNDDAVPGMTPSPDSIDVSTKQNQNGGTQTSRSNGTRAQQQFVKVTGVDATKKQVTISPGLYMSNWRASQSPQIYVWNDWAEMVGVEDLTIVNVGGAQTNVELLNCYNCWVRNIESRNSTNSHLMSWETGRIEVRDSYFQGTQTGDGDSRGLFLLGSSDDLVINSIFERITLPISVWGTSGSVVAFNFTSDMYYKVYPNILTPGISTEAGHTCMNLFEGNYSNQVSMDNNHGSGSRNTVFRNRLTGWETGRSSTTLPVVVNSMNHYENFVGNILGRQGIHNNYEASYANNSKADTSIFGLGYWIYTWDYPSRYDSRVVTTLLRHGNYDSKNAQVLWDPAIAEHALPDSLYLRSKPAWWADAPWPPFDPGNASGSDNYLNLPAGRLWHSMFPTRVPTEVGP